MERLKNWGRIAVGSVLLAPAVVLAQTAAPYEAAFTAVETEFTALLPFAYGTMAIVTVGLIIFALVKRLARASSK